MPHASAPNRWPTWATAAICIVAGGVISYPFWQHFRTLSAHLASGNWEITSGNVAVEKQLALKYSADGAGTMVHRVASSGLSLLVTEDQRAATIEQVAHLSVAEQPALRFNGTPLETTYGNLLRRLEEISFSAPASLPSGMAELIATARKDYDENREDRGLDFSPFPVTTLPDFDVEGDWSRKAVTLEQNGRCLGSLAQLSGSDPVAADISTLPRTLEVEIQRPWLSAPLLDMAAGLNIPEVKKFFSGSGPTAGQLRLIPQTMWILQTDALSASLTGEVKAKVTSWIKDNACCKVTCLDRSFILEPGTVRWKDNTAYGVLTSPKQQLFAIVSKRRGN